MSIQLQSLCAFCNYLFNDYTIIKKVFVKTQDLSYLHFFSLFLKPLSHSPFYQKSEKELQLYLNTDLTFSKDIRNEIYKVSIN